MCNFLKNKDRKYLNPQIKTSDAFLCHYYSEGIVKNVYIKEIMEYWNSLVTLMLTWFHLINTRVNLYLPEIFSAIF